ncbi:MFS transporter [Sphaerisporangium sp. NPDC051017]|uniref:MFS transporter n=1 Tax=Sphaerisporangium sp. NPDC051017 TaxID=3154636 RepID=UPI00344057B7
MIDAQAVIDAAPLSRLQKRALVLSFGLAMIDGFDSLIIGFVVPAISGDWKVTAAALTPVIIGGLLGTIAGALLLAPLADRFGRRRIMNVGLVVFGALTLVSAFSGSIAELAALRFCAGLGLGAVVPSLIGYCSEYAPKPMRATVVTLAGAGLAAGGFIGGFIAGYLVPTFGWHSVFLLGGIAPLVYVLVTLRWLPESVQFCVARGRNADAARLLEQIDPSQSITETDRLALPGKVKAGRAPMTALFTEGRALTTVLLWIVFFNALLLSFFIFSWMPSLLTAADLGKSASLIATSVCTLGGMIGGVLLGIVADRRESPIRMLAGGFVLAAIATFVTAQTMGSLVPLLFAVFALGIGVIGTQTCVNAVAVGLYPAKIRATGVGWCYGVGRVGSLVGPAIGGILLGANVSPQAIFLCAMVPAGLAAVAMGLLSLLHRRTESRAALEPTPAPVPPAENFLS